jgi:hypothetical protein
VAMGLALVAAGFDGEPPTEPPVPDGAQGATVIVASPSRAEAAVPEPAGTISQPEAPATFADLPRDREVLEHAFAAASMGLDPGVAILVVEVVIDEEGVAYSLFEAGHGGGWSGFWPASSVKLAAAVAAIERVGSLDLTGEASATFPDGFSSTVRDLYWDAVIRSSNVAYDRLLQLASPGFIVSSVGSLGAGTLTVASDFTGVDVNDPRPVVLAGRALAESVPSGHAATEAALVLHAAISPMPYDGPADNVADLIALTDVMRRVMLADVLPGTETFRLPDGDLVRLQDALCRSEPTFFAGAVDKVFPSGTVVCNKAGWLPRDSCVDVALVTPPGSAVRYLVGAVAPYTPGCVTIGPLAATALEALTGRHQG